MSANDVFPYRALSELADVAGGVTLGRSIPEGASVELPYLRVANVQDGYIDTSDMKAVRVLKSEVNRFSLRRGDVLLTEGGDFDKLGRGAVWDGRLDPCLHQNHVFRVRCKPGLLLPEYLAIYFASHYGRCYFLSVAKQTTNLATISSSDLKAARIPAVSFAEQQHLARMVSALRNEERSIESAIQKLRTVRSGVLGAMVPKVPSAVDLRNSLWRPVREVGDVRMGKQLSPSSREFGVQLPYLRVANVLNGWIDYSDVKKMGFSDVDRRAYQLQPGDILLNEGQSLELVGRSAIYRRPAGEFYFQNTLVRFRAGEGLLPEYAQAVFSNWLATGVFVAIAKKTTSIAHLGGDRFASLPFPLISLEEQQRVVSMLAAWDDRIAGEQAALDKLRSLKQGLTDDLLSGKVRVRDVA
ncbi:restriction endonuclease subunit S [Streptomyces aureocirculatus]|uniref:restriction endonuclease subunit S n=1 Tax=Streptomyces aureocirculatus TaxID=67275 RepID=UPI00099C091B|nr:restriction endonuclease subunit S [Streptomyces aureocirculatus]